MFWKEKTGNTVSLDNVYAVKSALSWALLHNVEKQALSGCKETCRKTPMLKRDHIRFLFFSFADWRESKPSECRWWHPSPINGTASIRQKHVREAGRHWQRRQPRRPQWWALFFSPASCQLWSPPHHRVTAFAASPAHHVPPDGENRGVSSLSIVHCQAPM